MTRNSLKLSFPPKHILRRLRDEVDESIPIQYGRAVFARAAEPKKFVALRGRHEYFQWSDPDRFKLAMSEIITRLPP